MRTKSRRWAALAPVVGAVMLVPGCSATVEGTARAVSEPPTAGLSRFYSQTVDWGSCDGFSTDGSDLGALQCARVNVPLNYQAPDGATASLALSRARATGDRIGSLLVNPGGPGGSGLAAAAVTAGTSAAERFDTIGFDPRGVGASTPAVVCLSGPEIDAERADNDTETDPAGIAQAESENRDYAAKCGARVDPELLAHMGSGDVARDMDVLRAVLGDDKLNYLGFSYGTRIGTEYIQQFPTKVRSMVLDGALDPAANSADSEVDQARGFQGAFDAFAADCATRPDCALGTDPKAAVGQYRRLVNPLVVSPGRTADPRGLSYQDAITGTLQALYLPDFWGALRSGLRQLAGGSGDVLLQLADVYSGREPDGKYSNMVDSFNAVRCLDDPRITDRAVAGRLDTQYRQAAPFLDDGKGTGNAPLDACAFWPSPVEGVTTDVTAQGVPRVVVVSTTKDPATPYEAGVNLAKEIGAALITFSGTQHLASFNGDKCVDGVVTKYFVDPASPVSDTTC